MFLSLQLATSNHFESLDHYSLQYSRSYSAAMRNLYSTGNDVLAEREDINRLAWLFLLSFVFRCTWIIQDCQINRCKYYYQWDSFHRIALSSWFDSIVAARFHQFCRMKRGCSFQIRDLKIIAAFDEILLKWVLQIWLKHSQLHYALGILVAVSQEL